MSLMNEQCNKVCRILDDVLANRPIERDSLIVSVRIAFEKQIPKKFKMVDNYTPVCPVCGEAVWDMEWCNSCGQRLDIGEED